MPGIAVEDYLPTHTNPPRLTGPCWTRWLWASSQTLLVGSENGWLPNVCSMAGGASAPSSPVCRWCSFASIAGRFLRANSSWASFLTSSPEGSCLGPSVRRRATNVYPPVPRYSPSSRKQRDRHQLASRSVRDRREPRVGLSERAHRGFITNRRRSHR